MKKLMIGIDVSKGKIDYRILQCSDLTDLKRGTVKNNRLKISKWLDQIDIQNTSFCLEHTGHYGTLLAIILTERNAEFFMINPLELKYSLGLQRGKNDQIDAYRIAQYAIRHQHKLVSYELPSSELRSLKLLMSQREKYVKMSVQIKNNIRSNEVLESDRIVKSLIAQDQKALETITNTLKEIEREMNEIRKSSQHINRTYNKIIKVIGVGNITALKCIIETNNFTKFPDARKFNCYCGLAPFPHQSGSSVKGKSKTHFLCNKSMKGILYKAAATAIQHDPQLKLYYQRKLNEGKHKLSVLNTVAAKLILRVFAVQKREEPFVKMCA